jgi:redox-sensitive bicupin YhaK (pirin superfamily)
MLDPFLLFDVFESDQAKDYIGGFPSHPHRGFETVTYLTAGRLRHKDNAGHEGVIEAGGVQWMTAGKGIVHSEMPEQENGLLSGYQLWLNLPAAEKMRVPAYQEFSTTDISHEYLSNGGEVRVIAGNTNNGIQGPVVNDYVSPVYMDITLPEGQTFEQAVNKEDNTFIYVIHGALSIGETKSKLGNHQLGIVQDGEGVFVVANDESRFLLVSARPLNEPVARGGPFVMNTKAEILQAFEDFQNNRF